MGVFTYHCYIFSIFCRSIFISSHRASRGMKAGLPAGGAAAAAARTHARAHSGACAAAAGERKRLGDRTQRRRGGHGPALVARTCRHTCRCTRHLAANSFHFFTATKKITPQAAGCCCWNRVVKGRAHHPRSRDQALLPPKVVVYISIYLVRAAARSAAATRW